MIITFADGNKIGVHKNGKTKIVYTNGKKVFALMDGEFGVERESLFETERCVKLATLK